MVPQVVRRLHFQLLQRVETEDYMEALEMEERAEVERAGEVEEVVLHQLEEAEAEIVRLVQTTAVTMVVTEAQGQTVMAAGAEVRAIRVAEAQAGAEQLEEETVPCSTMASRGQQIQEAAEGEAHPTFLMAKHTMAATVDLVSLSFLLLKVLSVSLVRQEGHILMEVVTTSGHLLQAEHGHRPVQFSRLHTERLL